MSHYYPKNRFDAKQVISVDDLNDNFRDALHEVQGNLGEQNWKKAAFTDVTRLEKDAVIRIHHRTRVVDAFNPGPAGAGTTGEVATAFTGHTEIFAPTGTMFLGQSRDWLRVADMGASLSTDNSLLWVMCDVQLSRFPVTNNDGDGVAFALMVDGAVVAETITGSLEADNEPDGTGLDHRCAPYTIEAIIPVTGGAHSVELVYRTNKMSDTVAGDLAEVDTSGAVPGSGAALFEEATGIQSSGGAWIAGMTGWGATASTKSFRIHNRNMIIIEMR